MRKKPKGGARAFLVSRCDRLGDLVLSLPTLGFLKQAGQGPVTLHCSAYAADIAEWARFNDLCDTVWIDGEACPDAAKGAVGLSLFHGPAAVKAFREAELARSFGPRSKLSALWSYSRTLRQSRKCSVKSEMTYNVELAAACLRWLGVEDIPEFKGLPALRVPLRWEWAGAKPDLVVVVSNAGSAANWPLEKYIEIIRGGLAAGQRVEVLATGNDAEVRRKALCQSGVCVEEADPSAASSTAKRPARRALLRGNFASVGRLIGYLAAAGEVVASSTGPLHLAHAAGVPVFGIYPTEPKQETFTRWRPDGYWHAAPVRYAEFEP